MEVSMSKADLIEFEGQVTEVLAGSNFKVSVLNSDGSKGHTILCYLSGKIRQHSIKIMLNDQVKVAVSPYDPSRGIIVFRAK